MQYAIDDERREAATQELRDRAAARFLSMQDGELAQYIEETNEILGEITAQHGSEVALYGDSWPGAQLQIAATSICLSVARAEWNARHPVADKPDDNDIDF